MTPTARLVRREPGLLSGLVTATLLARAVLIALLFPLTAFTFLFFAV